LPPAHLSDIVHLYLAVARAEPVGQRPLERHVARNLAQRWAAGSSPDEVAAVVDTAYVATERGHPLDLDQLVESLCKSLSPDDCQQLVSDLGVVIRATGSASPSAAGVIMLVRGALT
jgi:hypothetical protein